MEGCRQDPDGQRPETPEKAISVPTAYPRADVEPPTKTPKLKGVGLAANLTDECRYVREIVAAERVEGRSATATITGQWLACRLIPGASPETADQQGGRIAVSARAELIVGPNGIDFRPSDRIEVRSKVMGNGTWRVTAAPEIAARRTIRAVVLKLERTIEATAESVYA